MGPNVWEAVVRTLTVQAASNMMVWISGFYSLTKALGLFLQ